MPTIILPVSDIYTLLIQRSSSSTATSTAISVPSGFTTSSFVSRVAGAVPAPTVLSSLLSLSPFISSDSPLSLPPASFGSLLSPVSVSSGSLSSPASPFPDSPSSPPSAASDSLPSSPPVPSTSPSRSFLPLSAASSCTSSSSSSVQTTATVLSEPMAVLIIYFPSSFNRVRQDLLSSFQFLPLSLETSMKPSPSVMIRLPSSSL